MKKNSFLHVYISYLLKDFFPTRISYFFCTASWTWHSLSRWIRSWRRRTGPEKVQICTIIEQWITVRQKKNEKNVCNSYWKKNMNFLCLYSQIPLSNHLLLLFSFFSFFVFFSLLVFTWGFCLELTLRYPSFL